MSKQSKRLARQQYNEFFDSLPHGRQQQQIEALVCWVGHLLMEKPKAVPALSSSKRKKASRE